MGTRLPGFVWPESMGNVGMGSKLPEFVPTQTVGTFGAGAKLPGFGSTFRLSSSSPGIVKEHSPIYCQIQKNVENTYIRNTDSMCIIASGC